MGFAKELFLDKIDEEFLCSICKDVLENPVQDDHDHFFCSKCLNEWFKKNPRVCPINKKTIEYPKKPCQIIISFLSRLKMKCLYKDCLEITSYDKFSDHLRKCKLKNSTICEKGCGLITTENNKVHNCMKSLQNKIYTLEDTLEKLMSEMIEKENKFNQTLYQKNLIIRANEKENKMLKRELFKFQRLAKYDRISISKSNKKVWNSSTNFN